MNYHKPMRSLIGRRRAVVAIAGAAAVLAAGAGPAAAFAPLTLQNGWLPTGFGPRQAAVEVQAGIVRFEGAMTASGSSSTPFTLPAAFRPTSSVYDPIDVAGGNSSRLDVSPLGGVSVDTEGTVGSPVGLTSLDGAWFAASNGGFTPLTLQSGWTGGPFGSKTPAARIISGIVYLEGGLQNVTNQSTGPFVLPPSFRPAHNLIVSVDLANGNRGDLAVATNGHVTLRAENAFHDAQVFTSLDGVSFAKSSTGFTPVTLINGWKSSSLGSAQPAVSIKSGVVYLQGAIVDGTALNAFMLPPAFRPSSLVVVPVDLCGANRGSLTIAPSGVATVNADVNNFTDAQCLTSLDGVSFAK
jgi:hypothetical protein